MLMKMAIRIITTIGIRTDLKLKATNQEYTQQRQQIYPRVIVRNCFLYILVTESLQPRTNAPDNISS